MHAAPAFDTHKQANYLFEHGFTQDQSSAMVEVIAMSQKEFVTKKDMNLILTKNHQEILSLLFEGEKRDLQLREDLYHTEKRLEDKIVAVKEQLENKMEKGFDKIDQRFEKTDQRSEKIDEKMDQTFARMDQTFLEIRQKFLEHDKKFIDLENAIKNTSQHLGRLMIGCFSAFSTLLVIIEFIT